MSQDMLIPDLRDIQSYMRHNGWLEYPPGRAGSLWSHGDAEIGVPSTDKYPDIVYGVVERLAFSESVPPHVMVDKIRYLRNDE